MKFGTLTVSLEKNKSGGNIGQVNAGQRRWKIPVEEAVESFLTSLLEVPVAMKGFSFGFVYYLESFSTQI